MITLNPKFTKPEESYEELGKLIHDAEKVLQGSGLPYRGVRVCKGNLGFTAALKYDIEVWMPSYNRYVEVSSCRKNYSSYLRKLSEGRQRDSSSGSIKTIYGRA